MLRGIDSVCGMTLHPFAILQPSCIMSRPLILARLCGRGDLCEYKLISLFALGAPRVASCENSHQRFPVRPCLYRSQLRGRPPIQHRPIWGSIWGQEGGSKNDRFLGPPLGSSFCSSWALLASIVASWGPKWVPKWFQNGSQKRPP